jgi:hypothetical protein
MVSSRNILNNLKNSAPTNQLLLWRTEQGLGEGLLIIGTAPLNPDSEDTWGPLPFDLLAEESDYLGCWMVQAYRAPR